MAESGADFKRQGLWGLDRHHSIEERCLAPAACTELPLRSVRTLADGVPRREATQAWSRRRSCERRRAYTLSIKCSVQHVALGNNEAGFRI